MGRCVMPWCDSTDRDAQNGVNFHRFPIATGRRQWELFVGEKFVANKNDCICSRHFAKEAFTTTSILKEQNARLKKHSVPTIRNPDPLKWIKIRCKPTPPVSVATQTESSFMYYGSQQSQITELRHRLNAYRKLFPPGIQQRIETGKPCLLSGEDKSYCAALESMGPTAYQYMIAEGFPFPSKATLKRREREIKKE